MAKRKSANPFLGRWFIEQMDQWDIEEESEELQAMIEFAPHDVARFQFAGVYGEVDYRLGQRDGRPAVEFSWEGHDEWDHLFGRGWAVVDGDALSGVIYFHLGDESGFTAKRAEKAVRPKHK